MTCLKSPVNRMGGKFYLTDWLTQKIPRHVLYCEVFTGAAHLLFNKPKSQVEVINDIDGHLINFFKVIQDAEKCQILTNVLNLMPYSRKLWQDLRYQWKHGNIPGDPIEAAAQWFYLNRTCFSGDQLRGGFAVPSTTGRNPAQSFRTSIASFGDIADRLQNVTIECLNYADCIQRYDSKDTFFFCDPPYLNAEHYYNRGNFAYDDHRTLSDLLHEVKSKVMITHYQNGLYDELYRDWQRYEYSSFKGSHKSDGKEKPKTLECLWTNFEPEVRTRNLFAGVSL